MAGGMKIGELARKARLNPKTIRYYEGIGLLPKVRRNASGYRLYSEHELARLRLISRSRLLGLSLKEAKEIVAYAMDGRCHPLQSRLRVLVAEKLAQVDTKIAELVAFKSDLQRYGEELARRLDAGQEQAPAGARSSACQCIGGNLSP